MNFRLTCADFTFPLLSHENALKLIAMLGFEGVDIGLFEGRSHLWPSREFDDPRRSGAELKQKLNDLGLVTADVFLQMDPDFQPFAINHPDASRRTRARDWFLCTLEYAAAAGSKHVTTLPGVHFEDEDYGGSYARAVDELAWRVEQSIASGIVFGVEAHVGSIVHEPSKAEWLVRDVPGLTLTLDYTHFTRLGMADSEVEPLVPLASHFHMRGAAAGRLQTSFQNNIIDYARVLKLMENCRYSGWIGIEYVWIDWEHCNECDNLSETILFRDWVKSQLSRS